MNELFLMLQCVADAIDGGLHADQLKRIQVRVRLSFEKDACVRIRGDAAVEQDLFKDGRELGESLVGLRSNGWCDHPAFSVHHFL